MLGIHYLKASPTTYVIQYKAGRIVRQGRGLAFFYFGPGSVIVQVPSGSMDVPFVFEEVTADYQEVTIQGQITYRVVKPAELAALLDYSVDHNGRYRSDDPTKLNDRLIQSAQVLARSYTQQRNLAAVLESSPQLMEHTLGGLRSAEVAAMLGLEILGLTIHSVKATPEMAKALQTDARERLLQQADQAIYARRNVAVELERKIKENELLTQIAVEQKQREVRETKLAADIAVEQQRKELVDRRVENERKEAQAKAEALKSILAAAREVDWRTLLAMQSGGIDARQMIAIAFRDLADNASRIGELNITSELLSTLLSGETPRGKK